MGSGEFNDPHFAELRIVSPEFPPEFPQTGEKRTKWVGKPCQISRGFQVEAGYRLEAPLPRNLVRQCCLTDLAGPNNCHNRKAPEELVDNLDMSGSNDAIREK